MVGKVNDSLFFISWGDSSTIDPTFMKVRVRWDLKKNIFQRLSYPFRNSACEWSMGKALVNNIKLIGHHYTLNKKSTLAPSSLVLSETSSLFLRRSIISVFSPFLNVLYSYSYPCLQRVRK